MFHGKKSLEGEGEGEEKTNEISPNRAMAWGY